jgi:hypothetical protein
LKQSYSQVHDSFEMLASLLRNLYPGGMPPLVSVNCPSGEVEEGSKVKVSAITEAEKPVFAWRLTAGKLTEGDSTSSILIDTTGLAGQTITVTVEINDRLGFTVAATCQLHIVAAKPKH